MQESKTNTNNLNNSSKLNTENLNNNIQNTQEQDLIEDEEENNTESNKLNEFLEQNILLKNQIQHLTKEVIGSFKKNKSFSLEKILIRIQKKLNQQVDENHLCKTAIKEIADEIEKVYPKGIESLFEEKHTSSLRVFMAFRLNCSNNFRNKYCYYGRVNSAVDKYEDMLKNKQHLLPKDFIKKLISFEHNHSEEEKLKLIEDEILRKKISKTIQYRKLLFATFEEFDTHEKILLEETINRYCLIKAEELENSNPDKYPSNDFIKQAFNGKPYYELSYQDFFLIM